MAQEPCLPLPAADRPRATRASGAPPLETVRARWLRRGASIGAYTLAFGLLLLLAPLVLPLLWAADRIAGGHRSLFRLALFGLFFLGYELIGLLCAGGLWLAGLAFPRLRAERSRSAHERLQRWWAESLFRAASRCFRLTLEVEGADAATPGPVIVMMRHASLADTLLPAVLLGGRGLRLRYVLKRELLWDPCLDVVGQRLPNAFIRRGRGESAAEIDAIRALGRDLGSDEGVLIYPEGTRFTPARRVRALALLADSDRPELLARAQAGRRAPSAQRRAARVARRGRRRRRAARRAQRPRRARQRRRRRKRSASSTRSARACGWSGCSSRAWATRSSRALRRILRMPAA
ncbi:MAG: hypothetical protein FJ108_11210 [Deltaproteobacteria bacterium]|nr:hypothetical protein [Deltaproteobacteria bacterium]